MLPWSSQVDAPPLVCFRRGPRFRMHIFHCGGVVLLLLQFLIWTAHGQAIDSPRTAAQSSEFQIKAAFIFHFAQLVDWPPSSLGPSGGPLTICTLGPVHFPGVLESTVQGKKIGTHPIRVLRLSDKEDIQVCHVLFVLGNDKKLITEALIATKDRPLLTVEADDFVIQGGMIGFRLLDNKVRFEIHLLAARRANLTISSRLLLLAQSVIGQTGQG